MPRDPTFLAASFFQLPGNHGFSPTSITAKALAYRRTQESELSAKHAYLRTSTTAKALLYQHRHHTSTTAESLAFRGAQESELSAKHPAASACASCGTQLESTRLDLCFQVSASTSIHRLGAASTYPGPMGAASTYPGPT